MDIPKSEEGLMKLLYKDLQKIARQRKINPKSKKVDIVKALLSYDSTNFDTESTSVEQKENCINEAVESQYRRSVTRSSVNLTKNMDKTDKACFPDVDSKTEKKPKRKRKARTDSSDSPVSLPVKISEDVIKSKPLLEISNSISTQESTLTKSTKRNTTKTSKRKGSQLCPPQKPEEVLEHVFESNLVSHECGDNNVNEKNEVTNVDNDKYYQKKGRKRRRSTENLVLTTENSEEGLKDQTEQDAVINSKPKRGRQKRLKQEASCKSVDEDFVAYVSEDLKTEENNENTPQIHNCTNRLESDKRKTHSITKKNSKTNVAKPSHEVSVSIGPDEAAVSTVEVDTMPEPVPPLLRSSTFTLDNDDRDQTTASVSNASNGKSIGKRIVAASVKRGADMSSTKKSTANNGLSVKKTISKGSVTKNTGTPGSAYRNKFGVARKAPNFKIIHQRLFSNMESIDANQKRKLERGQNLIMSPAPRCAVTRKSLEKSLTDEKSSTPPPEPRKSLTKLEKKPVFTIGSAHKPMPSTVTKPSVNRFGFKNRINKIEQIIGQKQPPVNLEKKKEQERSIIQGVRMNKRFMLQMQMRKSINY